MRPFINTSSENRDQRVSSQRISEKAKKRKSEKARKRKGEKARKITYLTKVPPLTEKRKISWRLLKIEYQLLPPIP